MDGVSRRNAYKVGSCGDGYFLVVSFGDEESE